MRVSRHIWMRSLAPLCLLLFLVGSLVSPSPVPSVAAEAPPAARPLDEFLNPDGTLNLTTGFHGSIDARGSGGRGWQLVSGPGEAPRFAAIARSPDGSPDRSPLAPDDHWDDRFTRPGTGGAVYALAVDGSGNLYVGGGFWIAGQVMAKYIARWDGSQWSALGAGMNDYVYALAVDDSGNLYAGGYFTMAGNVPANSIARWDGSSWSALGSGVNGPVYALAVDGSGNLGTAWSALGSGMSGYVHALAVDDSGNLYAGGWFGTAGGVTAHYIARWDGSQWSALGSGAYAGPVYALTVNGSGALYAAGSFYSMGDVPANGIARWDGSSWSALGTGSGIDNDVNAVVMDSSGNLYAGGGFRVAGQAIANYIARWDGSQWSSLGSGMNSYVNALAVDSSGILYAGGNFIMAGDVPANYIARWDGSQWSALGSGMDRSVSALVVDRNGNLYAGGSFTTAGGAPVNYIARWDGSQWSALGSGTDSWVDALAVDGSGNLYAGGDFTTAGGVPANYIARWDGSQWFALGSGMDDTVRALAVDSSGNVYAGGDFTMAGGSQADHVALWNGSSWGSVGSGTSSRVSALAVDGSGNLYAGGYFTAAGDVPANYIARWDGSQWSALGSGMNNPVRTLAAEDSENVYAGGCFIVAGNKPAGYIARWFNTSPLANPDAYVTLQGVVLNVPAPGVLENDTDTQADPLTVTTYTLPPTGALALNADGSFQYTPAPDYVGPVTFTYQVADGYGGASTGAVTIAVQGDEAPFFTSQPVRVATQGLPFSYTVASTDPDLPYGDVLSITASVLPAWLTLADHGDGTAALSGTPANADVGDQPVQLVVTDLAGLTGTQSFTIIVVNVNDAPVAVADAYTTTAGTLLVIAAPGVLANDDDIDGDPLTAILDTPPATSSLALHSNGSFAYGATVGFTGAVTFTYHVTDGLANSEPVVVTITVLEAPARTWRVLLPVVFRHSAR